MIGHNRTFGIPNFDIVPFFSEYRKFRNFLQNLFFFKKPVFSNSSSLFGRGNLMVLSVYSLGSSFLGFGDSFWKWRWLLKINGVPKKLSVKTAAILNKNIEFYSSISYTVIKDNQEPVRLKLHIGNIVDLNEESKGVAYAKIEFIIQHKANNDAHFMIKSWKNHVGFEFFQSILLITYLKFTLFTNVKVHVAPSIMRLIERNSFKNQVVHEFIGENFNLNRNFYHTIIILFYYF
ncbi:unnamed protein product [Rhizophagus irregularis]|nr:unnamed protein product [Rhizophagus irregularis]